LEQPTEGTITIDGRDVTTLGARERGVAMVFQNYALYPNKTAAQNIEFPLRMAGVSRGERRGRTAEVARILRLENLLHRKPAELSGGQKQRVGIGRALVRGPSVLLMDEPLSNLDSELRLQMRSELLALQRSLGVTTIYVTHDLSEAMTLGDHIAVLRDGVVAQAGAPSDVFGRPATTDVARFLGGMNLLDGEVMDRSLRLGNGATIDLPSGLGLPYAGRITLGVRPEHLRPPSGPGSLLHLRGEITLVELLGTEQLVHIRLGAGGPIVRARIAATARPSSDVVADLEQLHLFDRGGSRFNSTTPVGAKSSVPADVRST
jgi:ABC-type sugar transport system ATPase subunit